MRKDWLWDRRLTEKQAKKILNNPAHPRFISLASLLLTRKNVPKEIFGVYLKPDGFCRNWAEIKRKMRKDAWGNPRIEFWQAIYEKLLERYRAKGVSIFTKSASKPVDGFCLEMGEKIKILRKQKNLTQNMLADKLNISQQMVSLIESGGENISLLTLKKIMDALGGDISIK